MIPAFNACTASPEPGMRTSRTVSAIPITSTSLCPAPTVSRKTTSLPAASSTSSACSVASARPPRWPRVPIERMKTSGSRKWSLSRIRSPSSAPCVNGLDGIDRDDADRHVALADVPDQRRDEARLADAGRPGDADRVRGAGLRDRGRPRRRRRAGRRPRRARSCVRARAGRRRGRRRRESSRVHSRRPATQRNLLSSRLRPASARGRASASAAALAAEVAREQPARERGDEQTSAPPAAQIQRGARAGGRGARRVPCRPRRGRTCAHHERERPAAHQVERAALDEERVAGDGRTVPDARDDVQPRRPPRRWGWPPPPR